MPVPSNSDLNLNRQEDLREAERREARSRQQQQRSSPPIEHDKPVMRFRLLAGAYVGADLRAEPVPVYNNATGEPIINPRTRQPVLRRPSKQWVAGDVVESDIDLVERGGANKFLRLADGPQSMRDDQRKTIMRTEEFHRNDPAAEVLERTPPKAPQGQVSTGYQEAMPTPPEGHEDVAVRSGGLSEKGREIMRQAHDEQSPPPGEEVNRTTAEGEGQNVPSHGDPGGEQGEQPPPPATAQGEQPRPRRAPVQLPANLNTMSVKELREFAAKQELDLKGATTRDDIMRNIRQGAKGQ